MIFFSGEKVKFYEKKENAIHVIWKRSNEGAGENVEIACHDNTSSFDAFLERWTDDGITKTLFEFRPH